MYTSLVVSSDVTFIPNLVKIGIFVQTNMKDTHTAWWRHEHTT